MIERRLRRVPHDASVGAPELPLGAPAETKLTYSVAPSNVFITVEDAHPSFAKLTLQILNDSDDALAAVEKGPLPAAALERLSALQLAFAGDTR